ncbi:divergent polysaccharide deacetylase family protein [Hellea balneolensis]|uniref:divergent polysaccharide deacetylase family protein n=1 Tax=Hellea balneolensis TaxID=287478 RepID=UPI0006861A21|nr:divergent polysaccharide deacetylase family protein [Hellea balneolensis]
MSGFSPNTRRRVMEPLPSRKKHALLVISFLTVIIALGYFLTSFVGNANDAKVKGTVSITPMPLPPSSDTLGGESDTLPDLLAGEVPENVNPTAIITPSVDALGNPVGSSFSQNTAPISATPQNPSRTGLRTITIDGAPINGDRSPLVPAPISGLTTPGTYGRIPAISSTGITPLSAYKRPYNAISSQRSVSLIIGGLGVNRSLTRQAINELPAEVTLAFAAHAPGLQNWINQARAKGHEVLIELPMESAEFNPAEPGADRALMASRNSASNIRNLDWLLSRAQGYFGVTNYNGDIFLTRMDVAAPILDKISKSGLGFVFDGSINAPSLSALSTSAKLPFARGYNIIDPQQNTALIESELSRLATQAKSANGTIGVGFAYPETITAVNRWTLGLGAQGLTLAPASSALR